METDVILIHSFNSYVVPIIYLYYNLLIYSLISWTFRWFYILLCYKQCYCRKQF